MQRHFRHPVHYGLEEGWGLAGLIKREFTASFYDHGKKKFVPRTFKIRDNRIADINNIAVGFQRAGLPMELAVAAIINAIAESGLNPEAAGDWGPAGTCPGWNLPPRMKRLQRGQPEVPACAHSIGYFQAHDKGAGRGKTATWRMKPQNNIQLIIDEYNTRHGDRLRQMLSTGRDGYGQPVTIADLAYQFCWDIERPSLRAQDAESRKNMAAAAFPMLMNPISPGGNSMVATSTVTASRPTVHAASASVAPPTVQTSHRTAPSPAPAYTPHSAAPPAAGGGGGGGGAALLGLLLLGGLAMSR